MNEDEGECWWIQLDASGCKWMKISTVLHASLFPFFPHELHLFCTNLKTGEGMGVLWLKPGLNLTFNDD